MPNDLQLAFESFVRDRYKVDLSGYRSGEGYSLGWWETAWTTWKAGNAWKP